MARLAPLALLVLLASVSAQETEVIQELYADGELHVERTVRRLPGGERVDHGPYQSWHENGKLESKGEYVEGLREGKWDLRWPGGRRRARGSYLAGEKDGPWTTWHEQGGMSSKGSYEKGRRSGRWQVWKPDKSLDERRSGTYGFVEGVHPDGTYAYSGEVLDGRKHGRWTYSQPGGAKMVCATYDLGYLNGELYFFHDDGCFDPDWVSGVYDWSGQRIGPLPESLAWQAAVSSSLVAPAPPTTPTDDLHAALLEVFVDGEPARSEAAARELAAQGRGAVPAVLNLLSECDLENEEEREVARRLHVEVLTPIFGGGAWPWPAEADEVAHEHQLIDRWHSAWRLLRDAENAWQRDFHPDRRWLELDLAETALGQPPLPPFATARTPGAADPDAGMIAIGGGAGGKFGGGFGGRKKMRAMAGREVEEAFEGTLARLVEEQGASGAWPAARSASTTVTTSLALLALLGEGSTLHEGPFKESLFRGVRWLVEGQDRSTGRIGATASADEQALGTLVLAEATFFGPGPRKACERAVRYLLTQQLADGSFPGSAGNATGDILATATAATVLFSARDAGIELDRSLVQAAVEWALEQSDAQLESLDTSRIGAVFLAGVFAGFDPLQDERMGRLERRLRANPPARNAAAELLRHGGYAAFQAGGETWKSWMQPLQAAFLGRAAQTNDVEETATLALAMEVYFRYGRVLGPRR